MTRDRVRQPDIVQTDPTSSFVCDYVAGVNRVLSLPPYVLIDNIGRNVEVWRVEPGSRAPSARWRYDLTRFPDDPDASLLDVDLHAAFLRHDGRTLITVNHFGRVRAFDLPSSSERMYPAWEFQLLGDTERVVMADDCFVASSPRGEYTSDAAQPGLFLFEPIPTDIMADTACRLDYTQALTDWGVVTALAISASGRHLAVAAGGRIGVFALARESTGLTLTHCLWEKLSALSCEWLEFAGTDRLWAGGPVAAMCLDATSGDQFLSIGLPSETAWGYGSDPLVLAPGGRGLYVLGDDGSLHVVDIRAGSGARMSADVPRRLFTAPVMIRNAEPRSLGIGHAALHEGAIYAGFSRGGFWLFRYGLADGA